MVIWKTLNEDIRFACEKKEKKRKIREEYIVYFTIFQFYNTPFLYEFFIFLLRLIREYINILHNSLHAITHVPPFGRK